jgi:hypothetical protein
VIDGILYDILFANLCFFSRWKDGVNQLMGKVWDWKNMYGTKLKKFDGSVLAVNEDGGRCEDDVTTLREDRGDDPEDGSSGPESSEDIDDWQDGDDPEDGSSGSSEDDILDWQDGHRVVQFLSVSANFPICAINAYDGEHGWCIYAHSEGEVQEVYTSSFHYTIALCFSHTDMYCNKLKHFTFMLSRAGWNGRFGAHWTL